MTDVWTCEICGTELNVGIEREEIASGIGLGNIAQVTLGEKLHFRCEEHRLPTLADDAWDKFLVKQ